MVVATSAIGSLDVDHAHFVPRRHHGADRQVAKPHHARDHFLFAGLQHAGIFGFDDEGADLLLADLFFGIAPVTEQPEQRLARAIQQPHQRQRNRRQQHHRRRHPDGHGLGIAQRDLLRHQFADDQRSIGDDGDNDADADRVRETLRQPAFHQPCGETQPQCGAGQGAGQHADQGNPDLHGGEKFAGIGRQSERAARTGNALCDKTGQPRGP